MYTVILYAAMAINIVAGLLLILMVMYMQSKSEGMGGILGGATNISSRGIKGIDEQYRGWVRIISYIWIISIAIVAHFSYLL
ncbi:MAG TPA: hypothetical protein VEI97_20125 [bacterium]|nr:hypothetical protein [bacterium]